MKYISLLHRQHAASATLPPGDAKSRFHLSAGGLVVAVSIWLASVGNIPLWMALWRLPEVSALHGTLFVFAFFLFVAALLVAFLSLFAWRWTLKPAIAFCLMAAALGANFMLDYGIVIDKSMMVNVMQTDVRESVELLSLQLFIVLGVMAALPIWLLLRTEVGHLPLFSRVKRNLTLVVLAVLVALSVVMLCFQDMASVMRNHKQIRYMINPLNSIYALGSLAAEPFAHPKMPAVQIGRDARLGASWEKQGKPRLLVLVVGETARAANFSLNGYGRDTNPELASENVVSFLNVYSCGTSTAASLPCMFSHLGHEDFDERQADYESLPDVLAHAGLNVVWRDNNSGCKGICANIAAEDMSHLHDPRFCSDRECLDEILLQGLDATLARLQSEKQAKGVVVILHQKGSHGPAYHLRSPKEYKRYLPECETNTLQSCSREQVVNAYDNTIRYTDHFLAQTLRWLKERSESYDTAMLYVSDHGESLGENNTYLHGLPYMIAPDVQKHVPMIVWISPAMEQRTGITTECLSGLRERALTHDYLFHSVLGLMDVQAAEYRPEQNVFQQCSSI